MKRLPGLLGVVFLLAACLAPARTTTALIDRAQQPPPPAQTQAAAAPTGGVRPAIGKDSVKFLVLGDTGTGDRAAQEVAAQAWKVRSVFDYEFAIMLGDNMYGPERPQDFAKKFELPFKPMLDANVPFYAALGNHDDPNQRYYKPFGMGGQRFYSYQKRDVRFFVLDSNYMDKDQQAWLEKELAASSSKWKIAYCHHPLYSTGARHGSEIDLRTVVEPLFIKYGLNVVFAGHEHFYERLKPQNGIAYFTAGGSAKLRAGDVRGGPLSVKGFDSEQSFMLVEIDGDVLRFQTVSRRGRVVDSGEITRQEKDKT